MAFHFSHAAFSCHCHPPTLLKTHDLSMTMIPMTSSSSMNHFESDDKFYESDDKFFASDGTFYVSDDKFIQVL